MAIAAPPEPREAFLSLQSSARRFLRGCIPVLVAVGLLAAAASSPAQTPDASRIFPGILMPAQTALIKSKVDEQLVKVHVRVGELVKRGDPLLQLEDQEERIEYERAGAVLERAESNLNRLSKLHAEGGASDEDLENARTSQRLAKADSDLSRLRLSERSIRSPFSGVVAERYVDPGTSVEIGDPLLRVTAPSPLRVEVLLPEALLPRLSEITTVTVTPSFPDTNIVVSLTPGPIVVDPASGTFLLQIQVDNPDGTLISGVSCRVTIPSPSRSSP